MSARAVELGRLYVAREQIDALIDAYEQELSIERTAVPVCDHPESKRKYDGETMGSTGFTCQQCGQTVADTQPILDRIVRSGSPEGA